MTTVAVIHTPGNFTVVTLATEPAVDNGRHGNVVTASPHVEYFRMANIAGKAEPMKPVGEYDRPHTFLVSIPVEHYVCIFSSYRRRRCGHPE
jgi:hypothetical protein